ncbi:hypothetical protein KC902_00680, partial [Candidatus Kaiserbacteria bacterium]|nr:hypothetical protein [Candidatus Kaiserbacteria bacterium]
MNTLTFSRSGLVARFYAAVTMVSLVLSAFPAAFFVAEAETTGIILDKTTASVAVDEKLNFKVSTVKSGEPTAGTVVSVSDGSQGGLFFNGNATNGQCNEDTADSDNAFSIQSNKGICYSNATPGVYTVTVTLLDSQSQIIG